VAADGSVSTLVLDQKSMLAPSIASFVEGHPLRNRRCAMARRWRPRAPLRVRLRGKAMDDGNYQISMTSVDFSEYDPKATDSITQKRMPPPRYPEEAFRNGGR
jgi:hypothetical protein